MQDKKLKRGTEMIHGGKTVFVELDQCNGNVLICHSEARELSDEYETVRKSDLKPVKQVNKPIVSRAKQSKAQKDFKDDLNDFFKMVALPMPDKCMNCQKPLFATKEFAKRCVTCHILPKSKFPTLAAIEENIVFMGAGIIGSCFCHDNFDNSDADYRKTMPIYPLILERFETKLKPMLTEKELVRAYSYLGIKWQ